MEKRNTLLLTVIAIATLLVAVAGATFAYFASEANTDAVLPVTATTGQMASLTAITEDSIVIDVTADKMLKSEAGDDKAAVVTDDGKITVELDASESDGDINCSYNIVYTDKSSPAYVYAGTQVQKSAGVKEFTLQGAMTANDNATAGTNSLESEVNYDEVVAAGTVVNKATISAASGEKTTVEWTFAAKFYNIDAPQLQSATYTGNFAVSGVEC